VADASDLIVIGVVCFSVGVLTGVSLAFFSMQLSKLTQSVAETSSLQVEIDEKGAIKQVVRG